MLSKLKKSNSEKGFTIIEVMIVLAIAGLILLIVFLAVPALQRSSRNTQRKTDVGRIGAAATTVVSNLNGQAVTTGAGGNFTGGATGTVTVEAGSLGFYQGANINTASVSTTNATSDQQVVVVYGFKCGTNAIDANVASARSISVLYSTEVAGTTPSRHCVDQ